MRLGSCVAVVQAGGCGSDLTPSLRISVCHGCDPKKLKNNNNKKKKQGASGVRGGAEAQSCPSSGPAVTGGQPPALSLDATHMAHSEHTGQQAEKPSVVPACWIWVPPRSWTAVGP